MTKREWHNLRTGLLFAAGGILRLDGDGAVDSAVTLLGDFQGHVVVAAPLIVGVIGAVSLALGVIVVHGFPAMEMIYGGAILLATATGWNIVARRRCRRGAGNGNRAREV